MCTVHVCMGVGVGGGVKGWNGHDPESSCFLAVGLTIDLCSGQLTDHENWVLGR